MSDINKTLSYIQEKMDGVDDLLHKVDKDNALQKAAFDEHTKQDENMYEELRRMNNILEANTESLKDHIMRTNSLQELVENIDKRLAPFEVEKIQKQAIKDWMKDMAILIAKIGGAVGAIGTAIYYIKDFIK